MKNLRYRGGQPPTPCKPNPTRRIWSNLSLLADADVTWGIAALVAKTLGVSALEVEGAAGLLLDTHKAHRWAFCLFVFFGFICGSSGIGNDAGLSVLPSL